MARRFTNRIIRGTAAEQSSYPATTYKDYLYVDLINALLDYSDGTNWIQIGGVPASLTLDQLYDVNTTTVSPVNNNVLTYDGISGQWVPAAPQVSGTGGEANTASNQGTVGVGLFKNKVGTDLQIYKINSVNNLLTIALNGTDRVDFTVNESNLNISNMIGSIGDSRITDLAYSKLTSVPSTIVKTDQANTFGAFLQTFPTGYLRIADAGTNLITLATALQSGNYTLSIPALAASDIIVTANLAQTLLNKSLTSPTITGTVTLDSTSANYVEVIKPKTDSSAENILKIRLSEDTSSYISFQNATSTNAVFSPMMVMKQNSSASVPAGFIIGEIHSSFDSGTVGGLILNTRLHTGATPTVRPILDIQAGGVTKYSFELAALNLKGNSLKNAVIDSSVTGIVDANIASGANISLSKINTTNVALINTNNSFSAAQTISINTEGILDLYLPINTAASLWGIHFNAKDSGSTKTAFVKILASLDDNTDTSEDGSLNFYYQVAGTLARRSWLASNGFGFGVTGQSGFLSYSGLSGNRTYTFPDADSKLFGDGIDNALGAHYVDITKIGSDPTNPATDHSYIYSRNTDGHVVIKKSSGSVVDLESSAITNLDSLTDVAVSSPSTGQILKYNGTNFVNKFPSFIGYGNVIDPNATTPVIFGEVKSIAKTSTGATVSDQFDSTYGSFKRFSLSAANGNFYFWKGGNKIADSTVFTYWKFVFRLNNTSNFRFDIGLFDIAQTYPANSDTAAFPSFPFFGAVKNTTSASLKCCHNDASGNEVYEGTAIQATSDTNWHTIEFYVNRTGDNAFEYSFDGGSLVKVTTDIPATTVGLVPFFGGFTPASGATAISFDLKIFEFAIPLI